MKALYSITIASEIVKLHPRTLMAYEKLGLLKPTRTPRNHRLYSNEDLKVLLLIKYLREKRRLNLPAILLLAKHKLLSSLFKEFDAESNLQAVLQEV